MNKLHADWENAKVQLDHWKKIEHDLRMEICDELLKGAEYGLHKHDFDGYRLRATRVANYSLDQERMKDLYDGGEFTSKEELLFRVKFELSVGQYKKADFDTSKIDALITLKDGMPQLEMVYF